MVGKYTRVKDIQITEHSIDISSCINSVMAPHVGGIDVFIGTVRDETKGKKVLWLEFEAYEVMALKEMESIADIIMIQWPVHGIVIHHRTGKLLVGEAPVVIAVSAAHRDAAFDACRYAIDALKQSVPIWKKEVFEDGSVWVGAHP